MCEHSRRGNELNSSEKYIEVIDAKHDDSLPQVFSYLLSQILTPY